MRNRYAFLTVLVVVLLVTASVQVWAQGTVGKLYCVESYYGNLYAFPDTIGSIINPSEPYAEPTCLAIDQEGRVLVGESFNGISRIDPATGVIETVDPYAYNVGEL
ncbi:hypothetical protein K8S17_00275, partial [bacterium]|nr:hypothetical protein [bacterium]